MSLIATEPTPVHVPDVFRKAVLESTAEELVNLRDSVVILDMKRTPDTETVAKLVEGGWPEPFARWYMDQVILHGPYLELRVPKITAAQAEEDEMQIKEWQLDQQDRAEITRHIPLLGPALVVIFIGLSGGAIYSKVLSKALVGLVFFLVPVTFYALRKIRGRM